MSKNKKRKENSQKLLADNSKPQESDGNINNSLQMSKSSKDFRIRKMSNTRPNKFSSTFCKLYLLFIVTFVFIEKKFTLSKIIIT